MSTQIEKAYKSISDLNLWFKVDDSDDLKLSDIPEIIPYRWNYFKTEWLNIKKKYLNLVANYSDPDLFNKQIQDFTLFIQSQNNSVSNPFSDSDILFKFFSIFDNTTTQDIPLTREESEIISKKVNRIKKRLFLMLNERNHD